MAGKASGTIHKRDLVAKLELASKGINPIDMLKEVFDLSIASFKSGRGHGSEYDAGPQYLAVAQQAAKRLSEFYAPKIGDIKPEEVPEYDEKDIQTYTALDAQKIREVIMSDPFAGKELIIQEKAIGPILNGGKANGPK